MGVRTWCWHLLVLGIAYYLAARVGLRLAIFQSQVTPFWPPTGIAVTALLLWGRSLWPAVAVAAYAVNLPLSDNAVTPGLIAVGNTLAPLLAAVLLSKVAFRTDVARLRDAGALVAVGSGSMLVSAGVGTYALVLNGLPVSRALNVGITWWTGDTFGVLIVAPFLLALVQQAASDRPTWARTAEATALLALTAGATVVGFESGLGGRFLVFPVLAVAAVRFQLRGAAPATLLASVLATIGAAHGTGSFAGLSPDRAMVALSSFNACLTFTAYLLSALTADRVAAHAQLNRWREDLERLVVERTEELGTARGQLDEAQRLAHIGSYHFDLVTGSAVWSDELYRLVGLPVGSPMSLAMYDDLLHPDEAAGFHETLGKALATGEAFMLDHRLRTAEGSYRWFQCSGQVIHDEQGAVVGTRGTAADIDARKRSEQRFEQLVELAPDAMVFVDSEGTIRRINRQLEVLFGYDRDELVGEQLDLLVPERYRQGHAAHRAGFAAHASMREMGRSTDLQARRKDGSEFPVEISLSPLETDEGTLVAASIRDVTDRVRQKDELAYRSLHDVLTGLPNRDLLTDRLRQALGAMRREPGMVTAVIFLDLDRFKWVNDSLGHAAGDALLQAVATRLPQAVRPGDTVARFGGDEFVVLAARLCDEDEAVSVADRIRELVATPVTLPGGNVVVPTVSVGITTTRDAMSDPEALLRDADAAMYRAKEQGRNRTAKFEPSIHAELRERLTTAGGLRDAIEQDQLRVHYQPVIDLHTGEALAVEALVRWQHPERGLLAPDSFIALAEETGQIGALDHQVIVTACREFGAFLLAYPQHAQLSLNVNVSLTHLSMTRLHAALDAGIGEGRLRPEQLTVEVTESAALSNQRFADLVAMVKQLGSRVAVDDFGTGFSALSRLAGLGVDSIKIDRSFVSEVHTSSRARAIVSAMARLSAALEASVVAEGIEHEQQARTLRDLGCAAGQGFLWSPAVPMVRLAGTLDQAFLARPRAIAT